MRREKDDDLAANHRKRRFILYLYKNKTEQDAFGVCTEKRGENRQAHCETREPGGGAGTCGRPVFRTPSWGQNTFGALLINSGRETENKTAAALQKSTAALLQQQSMRAADSPEACR